MRSALPFQARMQALATIASGIIAADRILEADAIAVRSMSILQELERLDIQVMREAHRITNHGAF